MSNEIFKRINEANKFRESIKTEQISSPNNDEYTKSGMKSLLKK